ncbi:hypothetical protein U472_06610 [Orenia metallireducens]|uniref:DUF4126 domain-containing protein n=1 Tax=Orenia metallireducens TaxID=1413210 RepID=A0A1C0AA41_9FIRM|nr:DUF4126 domain-containing protein [Orenia metallireducens]OCL27146.1 hypothetical protein U472_06610 [Orenia metallireducens]
MNLVLNLLIGIGLSAASGFRVFIPLLIMSISALSGDLILAENFEWIGSYSALSVFIVATIIEAAAYYLPAIDEFLEKISKPATMVAGTIIMSSFIVDLSPMLGWVLAIIAGGGTSALVNEQRLESKKNSITANTINLKSLLFSTREICSAASLSLLMMLAPITSFLVFFVIVVLLIKQIF